VPNYGRRGDGKRLKEHSILAIEPMINLGTREIYTLDDGWTVVTTDGKPSVHYEHTTLVGRNKGEALSSFTPIEVAERKNKELNIGHLSALAETLA
jgi:methionyl aminopeptidase